MINLLLLKTRSSLSITANNEDKQETNNNDRVLLTCQTKRYIGYAGEGTSVDRAGGDCTT